MQFTSRDLAALASILRGGAAAEIMPRFRKLRPGDVRSKTDKLDLVTASDEAAEAWITRALERDFPGVLVVGEEASGRDPSLLARLAAAECAITLDPIDGTSNYAAGLPLFGVMAAVTSHGHTVAAVILDPVTDSFSAARRGGGAFETAADGSVAQLRVAAPAAPADMTGMVSWRFMAPSLRTRVLERLPRVAQAWDHRCAAHEYRALIAGHAHFVVFNRLLPWDHLPGMLLQTEAGGYGAKFDGTPYAVGETAGGLICAPDEESWLLLRNALFSQEG